MIPHRRFLDPRSADAARRQPICDAANVPLDELPQRTYELPPRAQCVEVAGPDELAQAAVAWLRAHQRAATVATDFTYAAPDTLLPPGRLWTPNAWLAEVLPKLRCGRALDLACGAGRDAVFMAGCGWRVAAMDVLPDAVARGRALAGRHGDLVTPIDWGVADITRDDAAPAGGFDLITIFRYLDRPLLAALPRWLRSGGSVLCEVFTTIHRARYGRPAVAVEPGELRVALATLEIVHYVEGWYGERHTARIWARLP